MTILEYAVELLKMYAFAHLKSSLTFKPLNPNTADYGSYYGW